MHHERLLVGVDASEGAKQALRWAMGWEYAVLSTDDLNAGAEGALDRAFGAATCDRDGPMPQIERQVGDGHPGTALIEAAAGAALLVVGARGHGGFAELLLGSTSTYCVHHGEGPVVVVR